MSASPPRRIAFLAFPTVTLLDLVGTYDVLRRLATMGIDPAVVVKIVGTGVEIGDDRGLRLLPDSVYEDLSRFDLLVVPGGYGTRALMTDRRFLAYLRTWDVTRPIASVCTGALLLGAAGFLEGKRATTHHKELEALRPFCREVVTDMRVVDEGLVVTAAGVTSSLDLGFHLLGKHWGPSAREAIARQMEYRVP